MKKILLSGGAGFIGSHIAVELRNSGFEPILIDNFSNSERSVAQGISKITGFEEHIHEYDCRDSSGLLKLTQDIGQIEGIIHLAAFKAVGESVANPLKYYDNNIGSMVGVLRIAEELNIKNVVFSSSCTVYGSPESKEVKEDLPHLEAYSPYGVTKQVCERMLEDLSQRINRAKFVSLRYFNPIGAHPSGLIGELPIGTPNNLVPYMTQTAAGLRDKLTVYGDNYETPDGTCVRDYIHVSDLALAHVSALDFAMKKMDSHHEVFNIGTGKGQSVMDIITTFKETNSLDFPVEIGERRPGDVPSIYANVDKANSQLGWKAKYSLKDALEHAWKWQTSL